MDSHDLISKRGRHTPIIDAVAIPSRNRPVRWRGLDRFDQRAKLSAWLYRIAFNEAKRRLSRRPTQPLDGTLDHGDLVAGIPAAPGLGPQSQVLASEFEAILTRALPQLPASAVPRSSCDLEGLTTEEADPEPGGPFTPA
jgi:DNA-directed RNA polymerase specialized sigma24 family protein